MLHFLSVSVRDHMHLHHLPTTERTTQLPSSLPSLLLSHLPNPPLIPSFLFPLPLLLLSTFVLIPFSLLLYFYFSSSSSLHFLLLSTISSPPGLCYTAMKVLEPSTLTENGGMYKCTRASSCNPYFTILLSQRFPHK